MVTSDRLCRTRGLFGARHGGGRRGHWHYVVFRVLLLIDEGST